MVLANSRAKRKTLIDCHEQVPDVQTSRGSSHEAVVKLWHQEKEKQTLLDSRVARLRNLLTTAAKNVSRKHRARFYAELMNFPGDKLGG